MHFVHMHPLSFHLLQISLEIVELDSLRLVTDLIVSLVMYIANNWRSILNQSRGLVVD